MQSRPRRTPPTLTDQALAADQTVPDGPELPPTSAFAEPDELVPAPLEPAPTRSVGRVTYADASGNVVTVRAGQELTRAQQAAFDALGFGVY